MTPEDPIGIIELDTKNIKCLIFKVTNDNETEIIAKSVTPSEGIQNDTIVNISKATKVIRSCISEAEKKAKTSLKKINVVFEQTDFLCTKFSKHKKIDGSKIHKDDIEFLLKESKKQLMLNDENQSIIHIFNHNYIVDGKNFVEEPIGVYANSLTHEITFITAPKNNLKNINQIFIDCDIEIERLISKTFALGVSFLNENELNSGSVIIDLGFEKTSIGLFKNLAIVHSASFPFGFNHITKDISKICSLDMNESENLIKNIDFSFKNNDNIFDNNGYLKNEYFIDSNFRKISKNLITNVIEARLNEIIEKLKKQLIVPGFEAISAINFSLSGEGAYFNNIEEFFKNILSPNFKNNYKKNGPEKNFFSCLGALTIIRDGWETEAIPKTSERNIGKISFFAKIFGINK